MWKRNYHYFGGRITLTKVSMSNLLVYYVSLMLITAAVREKLDQIRRNFSWEGQNHKGKIHFVKWDVVVSPKNARGLVIYNLETKNLALLAKWLWGFDEEREALWRKVIVEKKSGEDQ